MSIVERLTSATAFLLVAYTIGALLFLIARPTVFAFVKRTGQDSVPRHWIAIAIGYPATIVYAFVIHPVVGVLVALPLAALLVFPELFFANWKTEPSVNLPENVLLINSLRKINGKFETRVNIDGESWIAEFRDDGLAPPSQGEQVRVLERRGVKIIVGRFNGS